MYADSTNSARYASLRPEEQSSVYWAQPSESIWTDGIPPYVYLVDNGKLLAFAGEFELWECLGERFGAETYQENGLTRMQVYRWKKGRESFPGGPY